MHLDLVRYPVLQIRPGMLLAYDRIEWPKRAKLPGQESPLSNFKGKKAYDGKLTECAKKRLKRAITLLTATAKWKNAPIFKKEKGKNGKMVETGDTFRFKLNFVTLTLPAPQGEITDKQLIREVLKPWLERMKYKPGLKSYIWRAERQKNGNLHFHLVTDTYINYQLLRDSWNNSLNKFGFIDKFFEKHRHRHPNSTDVHAIKNIKNLAGYFMKYMTKGADSPDVINGKLWDCSSNLKQKHNCEMLLEDEEMKLLTRANNNLKIDRKDNEHCTMWFLTYDQLRKLATPYHMQKYEEWLNSIRNPLPKNKKETDLKTSKQLQQITEVHTQQLKSPITQQRKPDPPILPQPECPF